MDFVTMWYCEPEVSHYHRCVLHRCQDVLHLHRLMVEPKWPPVTRVWLPAHDGGWLEAVRSPIRNKLTVVRDGELDTTNEYDIREASPRTPSEALDGGQPVEANTSDGGQPVEANTSDGGQPIEAGKGKTLRVLSILWGYLHACIMFVWHLMRTNRLVRTYCLAQILLAIVRGLPCATTNQVQLLPQVSLCRSAATSSAACMSTWWEVFEDLDAIEAASEPQINQEAASAPTSTVASELLGQPLVAMAEASVTPQPEIAPAGGA